MFKLDYQLDFWGVEFGINLLNVSVAETGFTLMVDKLSFEKHFVK